jgi:CDP-diacylglycerol--glycerol-3-phosphate 3-phosphatidyltransferase
LHEAPQPERNPRLGRVKESYTVGARSLASRSVTGLAQTRVTPNALTTAGVTLCLAAAVLVPFESRHELLFYWLGAAVFVVGSVLDILDGALARAGGKSTPFGAFLDSTTDRVGEGAMLAAIALVFARQGKEWAVVVDVVAVAGSFLVPYARAKAEAIGLRGDVGLGSRAERVVVITAGLVLAPWGVLPWAIALLAATAWLTVVQRILHVRKQLIHGGTNVHDQR